MRRALAGVLVALFVGAGVAGARSTGTTLKLAYNKQLKTKIIVDAKGLTLYMFKPDGNNGTASCTNNYFQGCTKEWPPLIASGTTEVGPGLDASLVSSSTRDDKKVQVTYNGHALYYFHGDGTTPPDKKPGDLHGQNYLKIWWVLGADGKPIKRTK